MGRREMERVRWREGDVEKRDGESEMERREMNGEGEMERDRWKVRWREERWMERERWREKKIDVWFLR